MALDLTYIRDWRKHRGMTQKQAADILRIDATAISRLELGKTPYDQFHMQQLSVLYKCTIPDLLGTDPRRPKPNDALLKLAASLSDPQHIRAAIAMIDALNSSHK